MHQSLARIKAIRGGNRSGKTTWGAVETKWWACGDHPYRQVPQPCKILAVGPDWSHVGDVMWEKLAKPGGLQLPGLGPKSPPILPDRFIQDIAWTDKKEEQPRKVFLTNGSVIDFKSAEAGERKFMGTAYDFIWLDEEIPNEQIYQEIRRAALDRKASMVWTATPLVRAQALMEIHEMYADPNSQASVDECVLSLLDNPHIDEEARAEFIASIPEDYRQTRVYGEFLLLEGAVYGEWTPQHEVPAEAIREWPNAPRMVVIDPGYGHPCGVLWIACLPGIPRRFIAYREIKQKRLTVSQLAERIFEASGSEPIVKVIIDKEAKKKNMGYQVSIFQQFNEAFFRLGFKHPVSGSPLACTVSKSDIRAGIYKVKEYLMPGPDGEPLFRITDNLTEFKKERRRYRWRTNSAAEGSDVPIDAYNHLLDCLRYGLVDPAQSTPVLRESMSYSQMIVKAHNRKKLARRRAEAQRLGGDGYANGGLY